MICAHDTLVLLCDLPKRGLRRGDVGTVVMRHPPGGYEVEFMTLTGETLVVLSLAASQVRRVRRSEIPQARPYSPRDSKSEHEPHRERVSPRRSSAR